MTNFVLTTKADNFSGGNDPDTFAGPGGGLDVLNGGGNNDTFSIDPNQIGSINGGSGSDTVIALDNEINQSLTFSGVEILSTTTSNLYVTAAQLNAFSSIVPGAPGSTHFYAFLQGAGGAVDFSTRMASSHFLQVEAALCDSAVQLTGTSKADFIIGSAFNDTLLGGGGADDIYGGNGDDIINGGSGDDEMSGSSGNDLYYVNSAFDTIFEFSGQGTNDIVASTVDYTLASDVAVELLRTTSMNGVTAIDLTGNGFSQTVFGNAGTNILAGEGGNDILIGWSGADQLNGGAGSDTASYAGATAAVGASLVNPAANTGDAKGDTYISIENLTGSSFNDALNGNNSANKIDGGAGNDTIRGYAGNDTLTGGAGLDKFVFNSGLSASNIDKITDFNVADDTIQLDDSVFTAVGAPGVLAASAFYAGAAAHDADDRIIYYSTTGEVFYDADGNGGGAAVHFATLSTGLSLTNADFVVI